MEADGNENTPSAVSVGYGEVVYRDLWDRLREKSEAYDETDIVSGFPPLHHFSPDGVWVGAFSRTIPRRKWRLLLKSAVLSEGSAQATPPQVARAYLDCKFPKQLRAKGTQLDFWKPRRSQPIYTEPGRYREDMVYLDIVSAYWTILQAIGWDVDYYPGMLGRREGVSDFPYPGNKIARNSLITLGLPSWGFMYKDGQVINVPHSWRVNIGLWTAVQDILHGIADDMIKRAGAVYVNTDGYIIPVAAINTAYRIAEDWQIPLREKYRGRVTVYGAGAYSIGTKVCSRTSRLSPSIQAVFPQHKAKLRHIFAFLAERFVKR